MNSLIATKLNVLETAIVRIEEWTHVLFVVVKGLGARFVSKKVVKEGKKVGTKLEHAQKIANTIGGKVWSNVSEVRVYLKDSKCGYYVVGKYGVDARKTKNAHNEYSDIRSAGLLDYQELADAVAPIAAHKQTRRTCLNCDISGLFISARGYCTDCDGEC